MPRKKAISQKNKAAAKAAYNRLTREAQKYDAMAKKASPTERAYLKQAAKQVRETRKQYTQKSLRESFGTNNREIAQFIKQSRTIMPKTENERRNAIALRFLQSRGSASRFFGATEQIWRGKLGAERINAILEFYEQENLFDVMTMMERDTGISFVDVDEMRESVYSETVLAVQRDVTMKLAGSDEG